jgi:hypothetical protein
MWRLTCLPSRGE